MVRTFVINLDRSPARLDYMRVQGQRLNLELTRFPAVDGATLDKTSVESFKGLTPGEIGCFYSHRGVWEALVASDDAFALVLEDDARLSEAMPKLLSDLSWVPADADLIKFDTSGRRIGIDQAASPAPTKRSLHRLRTVHTGGAGYLVSRAAAARLLARSQTFNEALDLFLFGQIGGSETPVVYQIIPAAIAQAKRFGKDPAMASLLRAERRSKRPAIARRLVRELARPFRTTANRGLQLFQTVTLKRMFLRVDFR